MTGNEDLRAGVGAENCAGNGFFVKDAGAQRENGFFEPAKSANSGTYTGSAGMHGSSGAAAPACGEVGTVGGFGASDGVSVSGGFGGVAKSLKRSAGGRVSENGCAERNSALKPAETQSFRNSAQTPQTPQRGRNSQNLRAPQDFQNGQSNRGGQNEQNSCSEPVSDNKINPDVFYKRNRGAGRKRFAGDVSHGASAGAVSCAPERANSAPAAYTAYKPENFEKPENFVGAENYQNSRKRGSGSENFVKNSAKSPDFGGNFSLQNQNWPKKFAKNTENGRPLRNFSANPNAIPDFNTRAGLSTAENFNAAYARENPANSPGIINSAQAQALAQVIAQNGELRASLLKMLAPQDFQAPHALQAAQNPAEGRAPQAAHIVQAPHASHELQALQAQRAPQGAPQSVAGMQDFRPDAGSELPAAPEFPRSTSPKPAWDTELPEQVEPDSGFDAVIRTQPVNTCALDMSLARVEDRFPAFFTAMPARAELRDYLRTNCPNLPQDEVFRILKLAVSLEKQAIESYSAKLAHDKSLQEKNQAAKQKLVTSANSGQAGEIPGGRLFTRAEIKSMPLSEYRKHENEIFAQYRAGLLK